MVTYKMKYNIMITHKIKKINCTMNQVCISQKAAKIIANTISDPL